MPSLFSTDEVQFLIDTFGISLPELTGALAVLNDIKAQQAILEKKKNTLVGYVSHELLTETQKSPLIDALKTTAYPMLIKLEEAITTLENEENYNLETLETELTQTNATLETKITEAQGHIRTAQEARGALHSLRKDFFNKRLGFAGLLSQTEDAVQKSEEFLAQQSVPEVRQSSFETKSALLKAKNIKYIEIKNADDTAAALKADEEATQSELEDFNDYFDAQELPLTECKTVIENNLDEWERELESHVKTTLFSKENRRVFESYQNLRTDMQNHSFVSFDVIKSRIKELDDAYIPPLLSEDATTANTAFAEQNTAWENLCTEQKVLYDAANKYKDLAMNIFAKSIYIVPSEEVSTAEEKRKTITQAFAERRYEDVRTISVALLKSLRQYNELAKAHQSTKDTLLQKAREMVSDLYQYQKMGKAYGIQFPEDLGSLINLIDKQTQRYYQSPIPVPDAETKLTEYKTQYNAVKKFYDDFESQNKAYTTDLQKKQETLENNSKNVRDVNDKVTKNQKMLEAIKEKLAELLKKRSDIEAALEKDPNNKKLKKYLEKTQIKFEAAQDKNATLVMQKVALHQKAYKAKDAVEIAEGEMQTVRDQKDASLERSIPDLKTEWSNACSEYETKERSKRSTIGVELDLMNFILGPHRNSYDEQKGNYSATLKKILLKPEELETYKTEIRGFIAKVKALATAVDGIDTSSEGINAQQQEKDKSERKEKCLFKLSNIREIKPYETQIAKFEKDICTADNEKLQEILSSLVTLEVSVRMEIQALKTLREEIMTLHSQIMVEFESKKNIRTEMFAITRLFEWDTTYIEKAFELVESRLMQFPKNYIKQLSTLQLIQEHKILLKELQTEIQGLDTEKLGGFAKTSKDNDKKLRNIEKAIAKASDVAQYFPSEYKTLQETLASQKESIKHEDPKKSRQTLLMLEEKLRFQKLQTDLLKPEISSLQTKAVTLRSDVKKNQSSYHACPKVFQMIKDSLKSMRTINTNDDYEAACSRYQKLEDMHKKCLKTPESLNNDERNLEDQEAHAQRQEEEWQSVIAAFKSTQMAELERIVTEQKSTFTGKEKARVVEEKKLADKALEHAEKAAEKKNYEQGFSHLKEVKRILEHLKKFPQGVAAHRSKTIGTFPDKWREAVTQYMTSIDALSTEIQKRDAGDNTGLMADLNKSIQECKTLFDTGAFSFAVTSLQQRRNVLKAKEEGLNIVRDYRNLLQRDLLKRMERNPFGVDIAIPSLRFHLSVFEKSFLMFE